MDFNAKGHALVVGRVPGGELQRISLENFGVGFSFWPRVLRGNNKGEVVTID